MVSGPPQLPCRAAGPTPALGGFGLVRHRPAFPPAHVGRRVRLRRQRVPPDIARRIHGMEGGDRAPARPVGAGRYDSSLRAGNAVPQVGVAPMSYPPAARPLVSSLQQHLESAQTPQSRYGTGEAAWHGIRADELMDINAAIWIAGPDRKFPELTYVETCPTVNSTRIRGLEIRAGKHDTVLALGGAIHTDSSLGRCDATPLSGRTGGVNEGGGK